MKADNDVVDPGYTSTDKVDAATMGAEERLAYLSEGEADVETAERLLTQLESIGGSPEDWDLVADLVEERAETFSRLLADPADLDRSRAEFLLRNVFATRRSSGDLLESHGHDGFVSLVDDLLRGDGDRAHRFDRFVEELDAEPPVARSLASELLHATDPERNALWTRWMWNPESQTGALPLLTGADAELRGDSPGETYDAVCRAVDGVAEETGDLSLAGNGPSGTDVLCAAAHCSYTYLTLAMRMGKDFTQFIPEPPMYVARVLGVNELFEKAKTEGT